MSELFYRDERDMKGIYGAVDILPVGDSLEVGVAAKDRASGVSSTIQSRFKQKVSTAIVDIPDPVRGQVKVWRMA
jgi:hypothetical protein